MKSHDFRNMPRLANASAAGPWLATAEVVLATNNAIVVTFGVRQVDASLAVLDYEPSPGDRVLILGDDASGYYLTGVLATARPRPTLKVKQCAKTGATMLSAETGDLEIIASQGAVRIAAATGIDASAGGPVELRSRVAVRMSIADRLGQAVGRLGLTRRCAELQHEHVQVEAGKLQLESERCSFKAHEGQIEVDSLSMIAQRLSVQAGTLLSKVENAYHTVAGLWQLVADRTRMVVRGTSHHKAARLYSLADDVKVKADKIHLG